MTQKWHTKLCLSSTGLAHPTGFSDWRGEIVLQHGHCGDGTLVLSPDKSLNTNFTSTDASHFQDPDDLSSACLLLNLAETWELKTQSSRVFKQPIILDLKVRHKPSLVNVRTGLPGVTFK